MRNPIRKALTRTVWIEDTRKSKPHRVEVAPSQKLVYGMYFAIAMTLCLTALEIAHMALLGVWNSEIFAAITGLSGTIIGLFLGAKS